MVVPPIINAFNGSSGLSARAIGTDNVGFDANSSIEAPANTAMNSER